MTLSKLSERELATILAALRHAQRDLPALSQYPHFEHPNDCLDADEIEALCERLNLEE